MWQKGMGLHTERQCFGVAFCVCAWCPRVDHRGMLRFDYASPSASSPLLPLSLHASINDDLLDDILSHRTAISFASAACVSKSSWNQICSRILARPKLASALSLHPSPKVAVKEVIETVLTGSIRPRFVVANIGSGFGLYDISKFLDARSGNLFCPFLLRQSGLAIFQSRSFQQHPLAIQIFVSTHTSQNLQDAMVIFSMI
ncbi:hypothetical protein DVH24_016110 [Malus domestica]|uniref:F-box domain-containing protein n=1 Tax=Malus domestica TaxID=3750 RepID=A0A498JJS6_MALDO|nr:hypothetical protein DVH24_016110 [Malus domestica]